MKKTKQLINSANISADPWHMENSTELAGLVAVCGGGEFLEMGYSVWLTWRSTLAFRNSSIADIISNVE